MTRVHTILGEYLRRAGALKPIMMGESDRAVTLTDEDRQALYKRLLKEARFNNRMVIAIMVLHFALFILALWLIYYYRESFNIILGGSIVSLLAITKNLISLWREKWMIDILVNSLPNLTPEQALTFVRSFYYSRQSSRSLQIDTKQTPKDD